ncbi:glycerol-3-phosphate acyltransferase 1, mitochondrial isoform X2 [Anabrus simplex]|uniref:glycerol-3-phosphate acyltransferase 1, mitochondrial isoform X2 n=1 Tax=Anabrus simplex TaxID=316456 RepID=UPI0035A378D0
MAHSMLDVITNRAQELFAHWDPRQAAETSNQWALTTSALRQRGYQERRRRRAAVKENIRKAQKNQQVRLKQLQWNVYWGKSDRPFMGLCCSTCTPSSRNSFVNEATRTYNVRNILLMDSEHIKNGFFSRTFCHLATVWQLKKYDYPQVCATVLRDERLRQAIEMAAQRDLTEAGTSDEKVYASLIKKHEKRAVDIVHNMKSTLSDFLLRLTSWVLYKLLPCFLTSVVAHPGQVKMLKQASQTGLPLVFMPLHRSHLDYILISFILLNNNIKSPLVAAGDNLRIPVFGWLLRGLGAFFIKRRMDPITGHRDLVYRAALHTYMMECLRAGHNMEFFIEGGRTRTGKPCLPKGGLLSIIVDAYVDGTIEDALLVPVSVNYEKLVDGNFVRELLGQPKEMETFSNAIRGIWSTLNSNYGMMRIDFNQPFSLRELVTSFHANGKAKLYVPMESLRDDRPGFSDTNSNSLLPVSDKHLHAIPSSASLFGTDFVDENNRLLVESIARHVMFDACTSMAVMSTNAVAFLLLNKYRAGTSLDNLVKALDALRKELMYGEKDMGFTGESVDVINHAVELLGPGLVKRERRLQHVDGESEPEPVVYITPVTMLPNVIELSYYSNAVTPFYILDAVLVTALYSLLPFDLYNPGGDADSADRSISHAKIIRAACELCDILQFEYIFTRPCQHLEYALQDKIENLKVKDILVENMRELTAEEERCMRFAKYVVDDNSSEEEGGSLSNSPEYIVKTDRESVRHLDFLHGLLRPLVDMYASSALVISRLVDRELTEKELVQEVLAEMKTQLDRGIAHYPESLSVDPIKNSLKLFERWGVIECYLQDKLKLYYLKDEYNTDSSVRKVFEKITKYQWSIGRQ